MPLNMLHRKVRKLTAANSEVDLGVWPAGVYGLQVAGDFQSNTIRFETDIGSGFTTVGSNGEFTEDGTGRLDLPHAANLKAVSADSATPPDVTLTVSRIS